MSAGTTPATPATRCAGPARTTRFTRPRGIVERTVIPETPVRVEYALTKKGRALAAAITSLMTGTAYKRSAELAGVVGPYEGYARNATAHKRVMRKHAAANDDVRALGAMDSEIHAAATRVWSEGNRIGEKAGWRNAQASVLAPTGTIGFMMDCDTTGIEPDFALVKFKKLAGGGYFKIINRAVPAALRVLGYRESEIAEIEAYAVGHGTLSNAPGINHTTLTAKGFTPEAIEKIEKALPTAFDIKFAFNKWTLGEEFLQHDLSPLNPARVVHGPLL